MKTASRHEKSRFADYNIEWEVSKTEYDNALSQLRSYGGHGRQDMVFVTTVQGVVLTIIGSSLPNLNMAGFLLSIIAFLVTLLGINSQRRLNAYMSGYMHRARQIEMKYNMSLVQIGRKEIQSKKWLFPNNTMFLIYHFALLISWIAIWTVNILI
jgi:hypothetical protein